MSWTARDTIVHQDAKLPAVQPRATTYRLPFLLTQPHRDPADLVLGVAASMCALVGVGYLLGKRRPWS